VIAAPPGSRPRAGAARAALEARGLTVRAGRRALLDGVSLQLCAGEVVALLGGNGAGKTTLLRCLCGELAPDEGETDLLGRPLAAWPARDRARRLAMLPQQSRLAFAFTVLEVARLGRLPHAGWRAPAARDGEIARESLARTGCAHLAGRLWPTLSGGEQQRVQLARVLAQIAECAPHAPAVLLLDEPVASLDLPHQHATLALAHDVADRGGAVLLSLHDVNLAAQHADRVLLLREGRLVAAGPPRLALTPDTIREAYDTEAMALRHPVLDCPLIVPLPAVRATGSTPPAPSPLDPSIPHTS
jgi:iron complex transport system ATP-binding protein